MPLSDEAAKGLTKDLISLHESERSTLDLIRLYWKGRQRLPGVIPRSAPAEIRTMARMARVNLIDTVVEALTQSLFVDGMRDGSGANVDAWTTWQSEKMDRGQVGVHRAALAYGTSYVGVFGDTIRGFSPRRCTATYADDPDWPFAVLVRGDAGMWTMYDEEFFYRFSSNPIEPIDSGPHGYDAPPFVRFRDQEDLDWDDEAEDSRGFAGGGSADHPIDHVAGQVSPLIPLQDQVDVTTFDLLSTQHYGAFRQKAVVGWEPANVSEQLLTAASRMWTFGDHPDDVKFHEFAESDLKGYLDSRDRTMGYAAALSQTPIHELLTSSIANIRAEALVAAEAGRNRKVNERQTGFGESWEQVMRLVGEVPDDAEVVWRETSAQSFAATVDGLGKIAQMLQVPPSELWERIPGATQQEVARWRDSAEQGDALGEFTRLLDMQAAGQDADDGDN